MNTSPAQVNSTTPRINTTTGNTGANRANPSNSTTAPNGGTDERGIANENTRNPSAPFSTQTNFLDELPSAGSGSIISKYAGGSGAGVALEYSPTRIGEILVAGSQQDGGKSLISNLKSAAAIIASLPLGVPIYSVDESGKVTDTGVKEGGALRPGGTFDLMARQTTGFNVTSRAGETITAWLSLVGTDPNAAAGVGSGLNGVSPELQQQVQQVFSANPEIPAALGQLAESLKIINKAQTDKKAAGDAIAQNVSPGAFQKLQPNAGGGGGRE